MTVFSIFFSYFLCTLNAMYQLDIWKESNGLHDIATVAFIML